MNRIKMNSAIFFVMTLLVACPSWCVGQVKTNETDDRQLVRLEVKHVSMQYAGDILESVLTGNTSQLMGDTASNSFVILATEEEIARAKDALSKVDVKPEPKPLRKAQALFLQNIEAYDAAATIRQMLSDPDLKIASDSRINAVLLSASEEQTDAVRQIIEVLDRPISEERSLKSDEPSDECQVRLSWLVESSAFSEPDQKMLRGVRPSLQKLVNHLKSDGGGTEIVTLTDVAIRTGGGDFNNASRRQLEHGNIVVSISGNASRDGENKFDLSLDLNFLLDGEEVGLESRFSAPVDHPVAFSVSDICGIRSYLVIEVSVPDEDH